VRTLLLACFGLVTHIATFTVHVGSWKLKRLLIFCAGIMSRQLLACASCVACDSPREMEIPSLLRFDPVHRVFSTKHHDAAMGGVKLIK
jgi:hypothetical protein